MLDVRDRWQTRSPLLRGSPLLILIGGFVLATGMGLVIADNVVLALGSAFALIAGLAILARPDTATLLVILFLYSNAGVIAVRFHHVPTLFAAAFPALLAVPLATDLVIRRRPLVITKAVPLIIVFLMIQVLGTLYTRSVELALPELITFLIEGVAIYLLITNVIRTSAGLRRVTWTLLLVGAFLGALSTFQQATGTFDKNYGGFAQMSQAAFNTGDETIEGVTLQPRLAGPLGDQNRYAQIMLMLVPLGMFRFFDERSVLLRMLAAFATVCTTLGIALTFSRGAAVAFVMLLILMAVLRYIKLRHLILVTLGVALMLSAVPQYRTRLLTLVNVASVVSGEGASADGAIRSRATEGLTAVLVFLEHPIIGVGPGMFRYYYQEYAERVGLRVQAENREAHNLFLGIAAETGALGLICFLLIVGLTLYRLNTTRREVLDERPDLANTVTGWLLAIVAYLATGMFLHFAYVRYFWLILALGEVSNLITRKEWDSHNNPAARRSSP